MSLKIKINQTNQIILQVLVLLVLVLSYSLPSHFTEDSDEYVAKLIQDELNNDYKRVSDIAIDLQETLLISGKDAFQKKSIDYHEVYQDRFAFFLYENDTLQLWTDNHIPLPRSASALPSRVLQKWGSYQVLVHQQSFYQFTLVYVQIIMLDYPWQNDFLNNHLASYFNIDAAVQLSDSNGASIVNKSGDTLFKLKKLNQKQAKTGGYTFFLFLMSVFLLYLLLNKILINWSSNHHWLKSIALAFILLLWYGIHFYWQIPYHLFKSELFSPNLYAVNWNYSNLGNLFFFSLILFLSTIYYIRNTKNPNRPFYYLYVAVALLLVYLYFILFVMKSLVFDSQITIDLYQLASLNLYSYLSLWIIFVFQFSWLLLAFRWLSHFKSYELHLWVALFAFGILPFFFFSDYSFQLWFMHFMGSIGLLLIFYLQQRNTQRRLMEIITYLIFFTLMSALVLNDLNRKKERTLREVSALNLQMENDPYLESHYLSKWSEIQSDKRLNQLLLKTDEPAFDDSLYHYLSSNYFSTYLGIYNVNLIHCTESSLITVMPDDFEVSCFSYFEERIQEAKSEIEKNKLYLIDGDFQYRHYIGRITMSSDSSSKSCIFIEFVSKIKQQESGLPAILEQSHAFRSSLLRKYSYAYYRDGELQDWRGVYDYRQYLSDYHLISYHDSFFEKDGFQHYVFSSKPGSVLMISLEKPGILQKLASFAFLFLFYSLLTFVLYIFFRTSSLQESFSHFQGRLQYSMILLLLFSFVLIGVSSLYYIINLNQQKNADNLMDKARSVLIELEHKLSDIEDFNKQDQIYVESLLNKFSDVFFTDITLYSRDGRLLASSRPEVFQAELLAGNMNAEAFYQLNQLKNSFFIQDEQIGSQKYLSAYLPFRNQDKQSVAFLNLPYFAKQYELENEVSGFIVAFLNIYLFLLFIAIMITILISRYLSRPLLIIKDKISKLNLQKENEKIEWNKNDEIGELIKEYNRMVEELQDSAQKLAISQRESAWREMAQQIAHEIKNPLTPMKLNVQYLERAWDDGVEDFEERMKRITKALTEQIDALSEIAGQFSTFAAIEKIAPENTEIEALISGVMSVFKVNEDIEFESHIDSQKTLVYIDKNQMVRVLNNIYKNAVQALGHQENPKITTHCSLENGFIKITIADNGVGIPQKEISRIFEPRFTTKSSGMGLGLALVKKMLENANASIKVESEEGKGSQFSIFIPIVKS
jgi:signal transduction histidine kinase